MTTSATFIGLEGQGPRARALNLLLGVLLSLAPGAAWACKPDFHEHEAPVRVEGEAGAVSWQYDTWEETTLGPAEDLTHGFVLQRTLEGNWCHGEASVIVQDCNTGTAVSFGGEFDRTITGQMQVLEALEGLIRTRAHAGDPMSIAEISETAAAQGVEFVVPMRTGSLIRLGDYEFRLGEGCRTHYPELPDPG